MPIISTTTIKKPRKVRYCGMCGKLLDGETIKLFGMACSGDKPYNLYLHRECIKDREVLDKLAEYERARLIAQGVGR